MEAVIDVECPICGAPPDARCTSVPPRSVRARVNWRARILAKPHHQRTARRGAGQAAAFRAGEKSERPGYGYKLADFDDEIGMAYGFGGGWDAMPDELQAEARKLFRSGGESELANMSRLGIVVDVPRPPKTPVEQIASASLSGATDPEVAAEFGVSDRRVGQIRREAGDIRTQGRPRSVEYTGRTAAGREALAVLVSIAERTGWGVADLLVWLNDNAPRRK